MFFGGLESFSHSVADVVHFVFWRDVWIWTQSKQARYQLSLQSRWLTKPPTSFLATHLPTWLPSPCLATHFNWLCTHKSNGGAKLTSPP